MPDMPRTKFNSPWTVENIEAELNGVKAARGNGTMSEALEAKQNLLVIGTNLDAVPTAESTNPVTSGGVQAPLAEVIDKGAKNLLHNLNYSAGDTQTKNGITATYVDESTIKITGSVTGNAVSDFYVAGRWDNTATVFDMTDKQYKAKLYCSENVGDKITMSVYQRTASTTIQSVTAQANAESDAFSMAATLVRLSIQPTVTIPQNGLTLMPMICPASELAVSPSVQPYAPTNRELYEMILALQSGTRSVSAPAGTLTNGEPETESREEER